MKHVIKTAGNIQNFSVTKLEKSIASSLVAVHAPSEDIPNITTQVCATVTAWLENKHEVSTIDIRTATAKELAKYNKDAAVLYKKHKDIW